MCILNFPSALGLNEFTDDKRPFTTVFFDSVQNGPLRVLKKGSKSKKDTIEKNLSNNDTNEKEDVSCDSKTEETCYDEWYKPVSCSLMSEGGCPCPEGTERCNADLANGCVGYCTDACCDWNNEYTCFEAWQPNTGFCATFEDGCSCPKGQTECIKGQGFCSNACCDLTLEEHCYGPNNTSFCAKIAAGGCPCPEGQVKCGADLDNNYAGYCTDVCCDQKTEEICYKEASGCQPSQFCAKIIDGGCPCAENYVRCGQGKILCLLHCELNFDHYLLFCGLRFLLDTLRP